MTKAAIGGRPPFGSHGQRPGIGSGIDLDSWLGVPNFAATESILPFAFTHTTVVNPAWAAWNAAPSNPCGPYCLAPDLDVYFHVPAGAQAVAYLFHGGRESADMWMTGVEEAALIGDLVRSGYAVAMVESTHRPVDRNWFFPDPGRFDPANFNHPATPGSDDAWNATVNADEQLVRDVHAVLGYGESTKVFLVGFSSGAKFASAMAYSLKLDPPILGEYYYTSPRTGTGGGLNVRAAAVYNNVGVAFYFGNYAPGPGDPPSVPLLRQYDTPTIFNYGLNDPNNDPAEVAANAAFLGTLPTPVPFESILGEPHRLRADRFARVVGVSYAESRDLYAALVLGNLPYVDPEGFLLPEAEGAPTVLALPAGKRTGVEDQMKALRAEHHVSSQHHDRTVTFFNTHL
jgi:hypothetical protein